MLPALLTRLSTSQLAFWSKSRGQQPSFLPLIQEAEECWPTSSMPTYWQWRVNRAGSWRSTQGYKLVFYIQPFKTHLAFLLFNFPFRWPNQARIVATKKYKIGDTLVGLEGLTAPLTKNEEGILEQQGKLFSVGLSSK